MITRDQAGRFLKGAPSPNPHGPRVRKAAAAGGFSSASPAPPTKPSGSDGVSVFGGYIFHGETDQSLVGRNKWVTYDNMTLNVAIVASAVNVWTELGGQAKWTATANPRGGKDAERAVDIVTQGLFEAQMSEPWRQIVKRQLMKKFRGFALHEALIRRRSDGMMVFGDVLDRPQWSVLRWNKPDEQTDWLGIEQLTRSGRSFYIPRERLLYSAEKTLSSTPDGVGLFRQLAEVVRVIQLYEQWEGIGFQTDLRGMPLARAPLAKLMQDAKNSGITDVAAQAAYVKAQTKFLTDFLSGHNKRPDQGVMLDSAPYTAKDQAQTPSATFEWAFDIVRSAVSSMPEVGAAISRRIADAARVMCAEWLLLGGEDSGGAYSMHEDKTAMFGMIVNSSLADVGDDATRDLAARLVALNGLDPETCTPRCVPEPVATGAVEAACRSLMLLAQSGLHPKDKAIDVLRGRMDLPPAPDIDLTDWMLPRGASVITDATGKPMLDATGTKPASSVGANPAASPSSTAAGGKPAAASDDGKPGNVNAQPTKRRKR